MERLNVVRTKILGMKKCMNVKFVVLLAFMLLPLVSSWGQDNVIDEVVWVVGDEAILKSDVEEVRLDALYNGRRFDGDPYCVIPEEIAVQKLFLHQAALDSIEVSESEVVSQVDFMINQYVSRIGSMEKMEEYWNKSATQIRETLRENAREGLTVQRMQQKLVGEVKITPAEVRRYYQSLPQDSIPYIPTQVEVQIITQKPRIPVEEVEEVKNACVSLPIALTRVKPVSLLWLVCIPRIVRRLLMVVKCLSMVVDSLIRLLRMSLLTYRTLPKFLKWWNRNTVSILSS